MILKNKGQTVEQANSAVLTMSTAVLKQRGGVAEETEKLLRGVEAGLASASSPVRLMLVREKAKSLHEDLKKKHGDE